MTPYSAMSVLMICLDVSPGETEPGFITFRAINHEKAAMAICLGVKPKGCNTEHVRMKPALFTQPLKQDFKPGNWYLYQALINSAPSQKHQGTSEIQSVSLGSHSLPL